MDVLGGMILGWDRYISLLMSRNETVVRTVQGSKMVLVPDSGGVSRDLLIHGVREPHTTAAFTSALRDLRDVFDEEQVAEMRDAIEDADRQDREEVREVAERFE